MKLKQLLISTASIAALAVVPMSIVSCGNNNNNSVDQLPPANGGDNSTPGTGDNNTGGGDNSTPGTGDNNNQEPAIKYIDVDSKNAMVAHILQDPYIVSEFIKQVTRRQVNGTVTHVQWTTQLTSIEPGSAEHKTDGSYHYYNVKNLTLTIKAGAVALYYSVNDAEKRDTVSGNGSWTISVDLHFRSTKQITDISN